MPLAQLAKHIGQLAKDSKRIVITVHAQERMAKRKVSQIEILTVLREGTIRRQPEVSRDGESLECRMERYVAGRDLTVTAALCDEDPDVVVVTVFYSGRQR